MTSPIWHKPFDKRALQLIENCRTYARNNPAGLPGHNLMLIVDKMAQLLDQNEPVLVIVQEGIANDERADCRV